MLTVECCARSEFEHAFIQGVKNDNSQGTEVISETNLFLAPGRIVGGKSLNRKALNKGHVTHNGPST